MKIIIADHQVLFREGLSSLLNNQPDIEVIDVFGSLNDAVSRIIKLIPDILLFDVGPRIDDGLNALRTIHKRQPAIKAIVMANDVTDELLINSLRCGAKGFLLKNSKFENILFSIRAVERGEAALSRQMTRRLLDELSHHDLQDDPVHTSIDKLTAREYEVFGLLASGATNRQIAEDLYISENTVKIHVHNILNKLNLRNRREVAKFAQFYGTESSALAKSVE